MIINPQFIKPVEEFTPVDGEVYHVNIVAFPIERDWYTTARYVNGEWREPVTGEPYNTTFNTVVSVVVKPSKLELQEYIHGQNKEVGWWDKPRCFSTFTNLFHSEGSEALEGDRRNLPDDKLKHYPMNVVELGDLAIRCMDYLGYIGNSEYSDHLPYSTYRQGDFQWNLASLHYNLSQAWWYNSAYTPGDVEQACIQISTVHLKLAVNLAFKMIEDLGYDPVIIMLEKHEFNRTRPDHQRENRQGKSGQKEY